MILASIFIIVHKKGLETGFHQWVGKKRLRGKYFLQQATDGLESFVIISYLFITKVNQKKDDYYFLGFICWEILSFQLNEHVIMIQRKAFIFRQGVS